MITLCEDCFADSAAREVLSIVPLSPCVSCGRYDMSHKQGLRCHLFRSDPRPSSENFDPDLCRKIARAVAVQKIWPLMGGNEAS